MLCNICEGAGNICKTFKGILEYWICPCCQGSGVRVQHGPAKIGPKTKGIKNVLNG